MNVETHTRAHNKQQISEIFNMGNSFKLIGQQGHGMWKPSKRPIGSLNCVLRAAAHLYFYFVNEVFHFNASPCVAALLGFTKLRR